MEKDGGCSFKCANSKAWRTDYTCGTVSDFMAGGESHGQIVPAVPKGFVRVVRSLPIYIYCGDATTVPDTSLWTPHCDEFAAKLERRTDGGGVRLYSLRPRPSAKGKSVAELKEQYPWLNLNPADFCFGGQAKKPASQSSEGKAAVVQESRVHEAEAAADARVGSSSFAVLHCTQCWRWHHVPDDVRHKVRRQPT
jgi:hypothetical protein